MVSRFVSNFTFSGINHGNPNGHPQAHAVSGSMPLGVAMAATAAAAAAAQLPATVLQQQHQVAAAAAAVHQQQQQVNSQQQTQSIKSHKPNEYHSGVQQCLVTSGPPPQQHYRLMHSTEFRNRCRSDGYVAAPSTGFTAPQSGPPHQGPPNVLRGMQSTAPPTPPQQDINKMQQSQQQLIMSTNKKKKYQSSQQPQYQINKTFGGMSILTTTSTANHNHNLTNHNSCQINTSTSSGIFCVNGGGGVGGGVGNSNANSVGGSTGIVVNNSCIDRKFDLQMKSKLNNNTFQTATEFVPPGGSNASGNARPNQYRPGSATAPRGGQRGQQQPHQQQQQQQPHLSGLQMFPQPLQPVVMPFPQYGGPRPTSYAQAPFPFQPQHFQQFQQYFLTNTMFQPGAAPTHGGRPSGVPGGIGVPTGPNGTIGGQAAAQTQLMSAGGAVLAGGQNTTVPGVVQPGGSLVGGNVGTTRRKKREFALEIIHPDTFKNVLDDLDLPKSNTDVEYQDSQSTSNVDNMMNIAPSEISAMQTTANYGIDVLTTHRVMQNDMTPIVSAMSDAPSIEIPPKQQTKRKNKSIPIVPPGDKETRTKSTEAVPEEVDLKTSSSSSHSQAIPDSSAASICKIVENNPYTHTSVKVIDNSTNQDQSSTANKTVTPTIPTKGIQHHTATNPANTSLPVTQKTQPQISNSSQEKSDTVTTSTTTIDKQPEELANIDGGVNNTSTIASDNNISLPSTKGKEKTTQLSNPSRSSGNSSLNQQQQDTKTTVNQKQLEQLVDNMKLTEKDEFKGGKTKTASSSVQPPKSTNGSNNNLSSLDSINAIAPETISSTENQKTQKDISKTSNSENAVSDTNDNLLDSTKQNVSIVNISSSRSTTAHVTTADKDTNILSKSLDETDRISTTNVKTITQEKVDILNNNKENIKESTNSDNNTCSKSNNNLNYIRKDGGLDTTTPSNGTIVAELSTVPSADDDSKVVAGNTVVQATAVTGSGVTTPAPPLLIYNEGQWSPDNQTGEKKYDRKQLMKLSTAPASNIMPNVKSNCVLLAGQRSSQPNLMPIFMRNNRRGQSTGGTGIGGNNAGSNSIPGQGGNSYMKQSSMSGVSSRNSQKGSNKSDMIHMNLSLREDVKLSETENAWRPPHLKSSSGNTKECSEEELKRRVCGILNKLTPEKFEKLVEQILNLQIDTEAKVHQVMILVFEKAVDEPNFSVSYARLCERLNSKDVGNIEEGKKEFRLALLTKAENEFRNNVLDCSSKESKLQPILEKINTCTDPVEKAELKAIFDEDERKIRRRSAGTVRFLGELFNMSMLTKKIIRNCVKSLLENPTEDKIECLCKLLTTVGMEYEKTKHPSPEMYFSLDPVIKDMEVMANPKNDNISSRVRFMLQDVIDLRKNKWITNKNDTPQTMDQIQKEVKTEQLSNQYLNYSMGSGSGGSMESKKDDRRYGGSNSSGGNMSFGNNGGGGGYRRMQQSGGNNEETWQVQTSKGTRPVDTNKLGQMLNSNRELEVDQKKLGALSNFQWNQGLSGNNVRPTTTSSNLFAVLSPHDFNKNSNSGSQKKVSYNKGSLERDRFDRGLNSRTGSSHGSRENSSSRNQRMVSSNSGSSSQKPTSHQNSSPISRPSTKPLSSTYTSSSSGGGKQSPITIQYPTSPPTLDFTEIKDEMHKDIILNAIKNMVEIAFKSEYETIQTFKKIPENLRWAFIYVILTEYLHLGAIKRKDRRIAANIVIYLLKYKFILVEHVTHAYNKFTKVASDLRLDVPELWIYVLQFLEPLISNKIINIKDLWNDQLKSEKTANRECVFLKELLKYCVREIGPDYTRKMWKTQNFKWTDFMSESEVSSFIKNNKFEFVTNEKCEPEIVIRGDRDEHIGNVLNRVKEMLNENVIIHAVIDYLRGNIVDVNKQFIRGLTTTLCNYAIVKGDKYKCDQARFEKVCPIFQCYLDSKEERELECLFAMQLLSYSLEHPAGLLNELFCVLYDSEVIPTESFIKWRDSKEEQQAGKGVAVMGLNPFFNNILCDDGSDENN